MSNLYDHRKSNNSQQNKPESNADTAASKPARWSFIQSDLSEALNAWKELEKAQVGLSPEEEQLVKIKTIIAQLSEKLNQF